MNLSIKKHAPVLFAAALMAQATCVYAQLGQSTNQPNFYTADQSTPMSGPARRMRLRQMLERRGQGRQAQQGTSVKAESAFAAIDPSKVKVQRDVKYGNEAFQDLDIYSPAASKTPVPIVFFAHGGGWSIGNKTNGHVDKGVAWAEHGTVFVSINYRLAPDVMHPKQIQDVAQAFAWVQKHAGEFGGDPSRIFIMGHSAGAQLVDLLGTNGKYLAEQGCKLTDIKGVISLDTASLNLEERLGEETKEAALVGPMIKSAFGTDSKVLADASPALNLKAGVTYPPFLMFCGEKRLSCCAQHQRFSAALKKINGRVTVESVPLSHAEVSQGAGQPDSVIFKSSLAFVQGGS